VSPGPTAGYGYDELDGMIGKLLRPGRRGKHDRAKIILRLFGLRPDAGRSDRRAARGGQHPQHRGPFDGSRVRDLAAARGKSI